MNISPSPSRISPIKPSSNLDDNKYITKSGVPSYSSETKSLVNLSIIEIKNITQNELISLITKKNFSNKFHYRIEGRLDLRNLIDLTTLPKHLSVEDDLDLRNCTSLTTLPSNLSVERGIYLRGCTGLTALPEHLFEWEELDLRYCTNLMVLPENLSVWSKLYLRGCTGLKALPENIFVGGDLNLQDCTGLKALPNNLSVGGSLYLQGCTSLKALPENLSIKNLLDLRYCTSLTALPENIFVGEHLDLGDCTGLTALPENLSVRKELYLTNCTGLTVLPEKLSVGGKLDLTNCTSLTTLPKNLSLGGDLNLTGCTDLTALPNWITTMGPISPSQIRNVFLENTGLSDALIDRLQQEHTDGIQFHFSQRARPPKQQFINLEQAFTFWHDLAPSNSEIPELNLQYNEIQELNLQHDQATDFVKYLEQLTATADYNNNTTRPILAQRVMAIMSFLTGSDRIIKEDVLRHINYALTSCDDRIILTLDDLETLQLLNYAENQAFKEGNDKQLKDLGMQMMRLDEVKQIARDHMKTLSWVDQIEVELAFQIGVRKKLKLPGSTQHMIFINCAYVSNQDIENAVNRVNTHCSEDNLNGYLAQWRPWQKRQRLQDVPSFDQLTSKSVNRIAECILCTEKTNQMVTLDNTHLDYNSLVKSFLENGKNPLTNLSMNWSSVMRLIED